jgi:tape measure domain-containing protein
MEDGRIVYTSELSDKGYADGAKRIQQHTRELTSVVEKSGSRMEQTFDDLSKKIGAVFAVGSLVEFGKKIVEVRSEMESLQKSFESLAGERIGKQLYEDIKQFATSTPMMMNDLAKGAQTLLGFNIAAEKVMPILRQIGDISMGDAQKFNSLTLAFAQMSSTGKLMGQDLLQMINAGFNPLVVIAEKTGKSVAQLKDEMSKGAISVEMVEEAFRAATAEGGKFHNMLETQSKALKGAISNMQGAYQDMLNAIGDSNQGILMEGVNLATLLAKNYETIGKVIIDLIATYGAYKAACMTLTAVQALQATGVGALTAAETIHYGWLVLVEKAQALLNKTMLANPYILAATAITALVGALVMFKKGADEATESQRKLDSAFADTQAQIASEQKNIDELFDKLRKAEKGTNEYKETKDKILNQYGTYLRGLSNEIATLKNVEGAYRAVAKAARAAALARGKDAAISAISKDYGETYSEYTTKIYNAVKETAGKDNADLALKIIQADLKKTGQVAEDTQRALHKLGASYSWFGKLGENEQAFADAQERINSQFGEQSEVMSEAADETEKLSTAYTKAEKAYKNAQKWLNEIKSNKSLYSKEEYEEAVKALDTKKKAFEAVGGDPGGKASKKEDQSAKDDANRRQKLFEIALRQEQEQAKQSQATRAAINAARIASIADDGARQRAEEDEQHRLALEAIQNRENEMKQRLYEYNKSVWEAKNKNPKLQYSDTEEGKAGWQGVSLSEDQRAQNMAETEKENAEYARLIHQRYMDEAEAMRDFLKQYGTIEQQKYAITKEYDQKIAQEQNEWRKKSLEEEKKAALATLDARSLAQNIDWSHAFKGIGNVLKDLAKETLKQVSEYMKSDEFAALPANDKQVYSDLRQQLINGGGLEASNPFSSKTWDEIATITKEYQENSAALVDAMKKEEAIRKELNNAEQKLALDPTNVGLQAVVATYRSQLNEAGESTKKLTKTVNNQKQDLDDKTESAAKGLNNFNTVVSQITSGSLKGFADGVSNIIMGLTGTGEQMEGIAGVFGDAGKEVGGIIGAILSIIDMLGDKPVEFFDNLFDGITKCIEAVIAHIPEIIASVVKGAGSIVGSVFTGLGSSIASIFGGGEDWSAYDEALDKWGGVLDHWEDNVKYERELMEKAYGVKAIQASKDTVEAARKAAQAAEEIYNGWAGSGAGWFSHSNGYNVNEDVNWELLLDYSQALFDKIGGTAVSFNNFGHEISIVSGDVSNLFNLSWEELEKLKNEAPQFWASIHDTAREYLEQYIEACKAAEEAQEALKEKLIGKTREGVFDEFLDSLYDLADGSKTVFEDIANDWQKMVNRMAINNLVASKFQDSLSEWFDKLYELQQRKLDSDRGDRYGRNPDRLTNEAYQKELEELYNEYLGYFNSAEEMIKVLQELGVIKPVSDVEDKLKSSFDNIRDIFRDSLLDLEGDAESFRKKLNEILVKDLLDKNVFDVKITVNGQDFDNFDAYAEDWNKRYLAALESGDEDLLNALIEELVAQRDAMAAAAEDYTNRMREVTHDETFKNLTDSFISSLLDTNKTAEDWANEIGRTMAQRIIEQMIAPKMLQPLLDALQEAYNDASEKEGAVWKDIINNQSIQDALADIRKVYPDLQETVKTILQGLGVTIDETKEGFSDLKGTFVSFLTDLNKTAEDFGKDLGRTMAEQMIDALMDKKYGDELKKLNEDWADALEEGDPEKIEAIRQKILQLYKTIGDDEELQKLREAFRELNESTPFDNLKSSYLSTLMDMKKDTKDFVDDINKMIAEDFIKQFVMGDAFDEKLAEWKKQYQKITSDGNLSEKERLRQLKALAELIGSERDSMQAEANSILTLLGLNQSGNDSATMNMADKATYDQFELYLGIANAHLMVSEQHKQISEQILTTLQTIGNVGSGVNYQELIYMRLGTTNEYLLATKRLVSSIEAKMDTIAQQLSKL